MSDIINELDEFEEDMAALAASYAKRLRRFAENGLRSDDYEVDRLRTVLNYVQQAAGEHADEVDRLRAHNKHLEETANLLLTYLKIVTEPADEFTWFADNTEALYLVTKDIASEVTAGEAEPENFNLGFLRLARAVALDVDKENLSYDSTRD